MSGARVKKSEVPSNTIVSLGEMEPGNVVWGRDGGQYEHFYYLVKVVEVDGRSVKSVRLTADGKECCVRYFHCADSGEFRIAN